MILKELGNETEKQINVLRNLLKNSNNVAISGLLASIAMAYPEEVGIEMLKIIDKLKDILLASKLMKENKIYGVLWMDEKAFGAMVTPILNMVNAGLPNVEGVETKPGKFVEKILEDIMKDSPFLTLDDAALKLVSIIPKFCSAAIKL